MVVSAAMWFSVASWSEPTYFTAFVYAWYGLDVLITVVALPISMRLCDPRVAATQFTLYMATSNFGISVAAWVLGSSGRVGGLPMMFVVVFALHLVGLMLVVLVRFPRRTAVEYEITAPQIAESAGSQNRSRCRSA
jgi:PAT family beta-lactamase induction signal transducer AmpG